MTRRFTCKPSAQAIKAATSADMIDAFESRIAELSVRSKTDVTCSDESETRKVDIYEYDYDVDYKDVGGGFGEPGAVYSLAEIKEFWNNENTNDPILSDYPTYDSWFKDTSDNFLEEV